MKMRKIMSLGFCLLLGGCAGQITYTPPTNQLPGTNEKTVDKAVDEVWKTTVPALGKNFFVINNLDKSSGLINVSYSGDPEKYVDCGVIDSQVSNARGKREYRFPAAAADQSYEIMQGGMLYYLQRKMNLEGRVNLVFEPIEKNKTRVTANIKYVLTRQVRVAPAAGGFPQTFSDTISFGANSGASFPGQGQNTYCVSNGHLEREILNVAD
ncbi:MAG: hypothetical protein ACK5JE_08185 [Castellaniella sp.]|uniref:hypothetical protein n=1 Tax=Castellaniella sp. TaxID=1955812 RepID=UPI003A8BC9C6